MALLLPWLVFRHVGNIDRPNLYTQSRDRYTIHSTEFPVTRINALRQNCGHEIIFFSRVLPKKSCDPGSAGVTHRPNPGAAGERAPDVSRNRRSRGRRTIPRRRREVQRHLPRFSGRYGGLPSARTGARGRKIAAGKWRGAKKRRKFWRTWWFWRLPAAAAQRDTNCSRTKA